MSEYDQSRAEHQCSGCGRTLSVGAAFCKDCGTPVAAAVDAPADNWMEYSPRHPAATVTKETIDWQRFALAGTLGLAAALLLGYGWYLLVVNTGQEIGLVAYIIGLLVGLVVTIVGQGRTTIPYRLLGALLAAVSVIFGQYLLYARPASPGFIETGYFQLFIVGIALLEGWLAPTFAARRGLLRLNPITDQNKGLILAGSLLMLSILVVAGLFAGLLVGPGAVQAKIHVDRASGLLEDGQDEQAMAELRLAIEDHDDYAYAHYFLGTFQWKREEFEQAQSSFSKALDLGLDEETTPIAKTYLGLVEWNLYDDQAAFELLNEAIEDGAELAAAYLVRGTILFDRGMLQAAEVDLERALSLGLNSEDQDWAREILQQINDVAA